MTAAVVAGGAGVVALEDGAAELCQIVEDDRMIVTYYVGSILKMPDDAG